MAWQRGTECLFYAPMNYVNVPLTSQAEKIAHLKQKEFHSEKENKNMLVSSYVRNNDGTSGTLWRFISCIKPLSTKLESKQDCLSLRGTPLKLHIFGAGLYSREGVMQMHQRNLKTTLSSEESSGFIHIINNLQDVKKKKKNPEFPDKDVSNQ